MTILLGCSIVRDFLFLFFSGRPGSLRSPSGFPLYFASLVLAPIPAAKGIPGYQKKSHRQGTFRQKYCIFAAAKQERSSVGSERFSHIEEVIGSSPIVPTPTQGGHSETDVRIFFVYFHHHILAKHAANTCN